MTTRPILFSAPMIRALLDGSKTQTRRVAKIVKSLPDGGGWDCLKKPGSWSCIFLKNEEWCWTPAGGGATEPYPRIAEYCPYGQPGDRLWVKETFHLLSDFPDQDSEYLYRSTDTNNPAIFKWTPAIFMPRAASRITLEITEVRVQRLQDISEEDAKAEGVQASTTGNFSQSATGAYAHLWESINGPGSWALNPWVWALSFRRTGL